MTVIDFLSLRQWLIAVGFSASPPAAANGLADDGTTVIEILSSPGGAIWMLLYSLSTGCSCVIADGRHWEIQTAARGAGA